MKENIRSVYESLVELRRINPDSIQEDEIAPIRGLFSEYNYYSTEIPRIMFLGEFKAGKSSLLNALYGRILAATDVLEMTSWIARYWPSNEIFCRVTNKPDPSGQAKPIFTSPDQFLDQCQTRSFTVDQLRSIDRVDVGILDAPHKCSIIDAPGFGSTNPENENRMLIAIQEADFIFWVLSCEVIGSMKEAAIVRNLLEKGTPLACVLTKCDYLKDGEIEDIYEYLNDTFMLPKDRIFPISAKLLLEQPENQNEQKRLSRLKQFIDQEISVRHKDMRQIAEKAQLDRLNEHCVQLVTRLLQDIDLTLDAKDQYASLVNSVKIQVDMAMESMISDTIRRDLFKGYQPLLAKAIDNLPRETDELKFIKVINQTLPAGYMEQFVLNLRQLLLNRSKELWSKGMADGAVELRAIETSISSVSYMIDPTLSSGSAINNFLESLPKEQMTRNMAKTVGIAGIATLIAAASPALTIAAAISGIGIPVVLVGVGLSAVYGIINRRKSEGRNGTALVEDMVERFLQETGKKVLLAEQTAINEEAEIQAIQKWEQMNCARMPKHSLEEMREYYVEALKKLNAPVSHKQGNRYSEMNPPSLF